MRVATEMSTIEFGVNVVSGAEHVQQSGRRKSEEKDQAGMVGCVANPGFAIGGGEGCGLERSIAVQFVQERDMCAFVPVVPSMDAAAFSHAILRLTEQLG